MNSVITIVLNLIERVLPLITGGGAAGSVISMLESILPLVVTEVQALYTPIKNIITALQSSGALTPDEITQVQALDKQIDDAFTTATAGLDPDAPVTTS
jgi:hypothetical protein